jgi:glycosyltransferase involved in cell wall biosynthesis
MPSNVSWAGHDEAAGRDRPAGAADLLARARALLCVSVDPWTPPRGGQTTFARHLLTAFRTELAVVSTCTQALPQGQWVAREFEGTAVPYFSLGMLPRHGAGRPLVPARLSVYRMAARGMAAVHRSGIPNVFIDDPELLLPASRYPWKSACYNVAGVFNPAAQSRYPAARLLGRLCERSILRALRKLDPEVILAAGDESLVERLRGVRGLSRYRIEALPTRVDLDEFFPEPRSEARDRAGLPRDAVILTAVGRLCWIKGWDLLLRAAALLARAEPRLLLLFVGDGEDRGKLVAEAQAQGVADKIRITGFVARESVRTFLNAADACVVGSYSEGWSVAMLEALACGKPIVSTRVSGARDMIAEAGNGFIVEGRDPEAFAAAVRQALSLRDAGQVSRTIAARYSVSGLARELRAKWTALQD